MIPGFAFAADSLQKQRHARAVRRTDFTVVAALAVLLSLLLPLPAMAQQPVVQDVSIPGGGSERVLYVAPPSPRAILLMFAGGNGDVQIADSGTIGRMLGNFLLRTQPLWLAQGFAFATIGSSSSLMGQRHT